jgi:hypothetical protein
VSSSRVARTASVTSSRRVRSRTAARTRAEPVRRVVRSRTSPASFSRARARPRAGRPAVLQQPVTEAAGHATAETGIVELKAERVLEAGPAAHGLGSVTAGQCSTLTVASCAGEIPGRPPWGYHPAKSSSLHSPSGRSRTHIAVVPAGLPARAIRAASAGTPTPGRGRTDISHSSGISRDSCPRKTGPQRGRSQPNTKIPDRVKLRARADRRVWRDFRGS